MDSDLSNVNPNRRSPFMNVSRVGHITQAVVAFVSVAIGLYLFGSAELRRLGGVLFGVSVYGTALLFYASRVRTHLRFPRHRTSDALDDATALASGTHQVAGLSPFSVVVAVLLLICTTATVIFSVSATLYLSEGLAREVTYGGQADMWIVMGGLLSGLSCLTGAFSLIYVSLTVGQKVVKPVDSALHI